jgi:hypothetical protein
VKLRWPSRTNQLIAQMEDEIRVLRVERRALLDAVLIGRNLPGLDYEKHEEISPVSKAPDPVRIAPEIPARTPVRRSAFRALKFMELVSARESRARKMARAEAEKASQEAS